MITIDRVEMKTTKKGDKEYKSLRISGGRFVNMWMDDPDYDLAVDGATLDRDVEQQGKFLNLLPKGQVSSKRKKVNGDRRLAVLYEQNVMIGKQLIKIAEKLGAEVTIYSVDLDSEKDEAPTNELPKLDIVEPDENPEDIPF